MIWAGTKIEGEPDLRKDNDSKAIINTNTDAYKRYKQHQSGKIAELAEKERIKKEINILKDDVKDIKDMLIKLTEKL